MEIDSATMERLEIDFIDKYGLTEILLAIANICSLKAYHLRHNWQDPTLAQHWVDTGYDIAELTNCLLPT